VDIHTDDQPEHLGADLEELLAEDPRVSEQGLHVTATVSPPVVRVEGTIATPERRDAVNEVLSERLGGWEIDNQVAVLSLELEAPGPAEQLP
jgi:hypothetical protein